MSHRQSYVSHRRKQGDQNLLVGWLSELGMYFSILTPLKKTECHTEKAMSATGAQGDQNLLVGWLTGAGMCFSILTPPSQAKFQLVSLGWLGWCWVRCFCWLGLGWWMVRWVLGLVGSEWVYNTTIRLKYIILKCTVEFFVML